MIYSPKSDLIMKELFRNETVLTYFVSDILSLPLEDIRSLRPLNTFLWRRFKREKLGILDVLAELNDETKVSIELQVKIFHHWDRRQIFYLAKLYTADLLIGEDYSRLHRCVGISLLDFNLTDSERYHRIYRLRDTEGEEFSDILEIHIIELKKKLAGRGVMDDWIRFFNVKTEEDLMMIKTSNPGILEAIRELQRLSMSNPIRVLYEGYLKRRRDEVARENYVREEGLAMGREELLLEMLLAGEPEDKVKSLGKLTEEQFQELKGRITDQ